MMSTTSSTGSSAFTGSSSFASSLSASVAQAVSFASLPMQQLENQENAIQSQQSELNTLTNDFQSLQTALDSINNAAGSNAYTASVDNNSVATAALSSGALAGTYSVDVVSTGSQTNTLSNDGLTTVTDPTSGNIDSSTAYTLTVDGQTYNVPDSAGTLNGLAEAINSSGASVQATVVNVGSSSSPDYRLSVQGSQYSPSTIQLSDGTNSLLNTISTGAYVQYQVDGSTNTVDATSRTISLSTGLSVNLLAAGTANITVAQSASGMQNALSSFAAAYNQANADLSASRGQAGGALTGQSIISDLTNALQGIANYAGSSGTVSALSDVGLTFNDTGQLQFDSSTFAQAAATSVSDVLNYFGSETGTGFLENTSNILSGVNATSTGVIASFSNELSTELTATETKVSTDETQLNALQTQLTNQAEAADASISSMEQRLGYYTSLFSAEQTNENSINNG
jgi:flagellar hook-associated protein 2